MDVSVSIVTYNSAEHIDRCIDSLGPAAGGLSWEAIVVDNASPDDTVARLRKRRDARIVASERNLGFGAGHNVAFRQAEGRYFLCFNPDASLKPGALRRFVQVLDERPEIGLAGGRIFRPGGQPGGNSARYIESGFEFALRNCAPTPSRIISRFPPEVWDCTELREVDAIVGSCMLFRSEAFAATSGFDESFFMYQEAADIAVRLRRVGWRILIVPDAEVVHVGNGSRQQRRLTRSRMRASSRIFAHKHYGRLEALFADVLAETSDHLRLDDLLQVYLRFKNSR